MLPPTSLWSTVTILSGQTLQEKPVSRHPPNSIFLGAPLDSYSNQSLLLRKLSRVLLKRGPRMESGVDRWRSELTRTPEKVAGTKLLLGKETSVRGKSETEAT